MAGSSAAAAMGEVTEADTVAVLLARRDGVAAGATFLLVLLVDLFLLATAANMMLSTDRRKFFPGNVKIKVRILWNSS